MLLTNVLIRTILCFVLIRMVLCLVLIRSEPWGVLNRILLTVILIRIVWEFLIAGILLLAPDLMIGSMVLLLVGVCLEYILLMLLIPLDSTELCLWGY